MAKVIDITEKLSFDENPKLVIKGKEFEVNADAETMLKIMGAFSNKGDGEASIDAYNLMFSEKDRKKISEMKLPFKDLMVIIENAMNLINGGEEGE